MTKPTYQISRPFHLAHRRRYRRYSLLMTFIFLLLGIVVGVVIFNIYHLKDQPFKRSVGATFTQVIAGAQTFRSTYFEFSDTSKWVFAPNDSTANLFTYLLYADGVPAYSLSVYVNQTPVQYNLATTYVLPVQIKNNNSFIEGNISAPCNSVYQPSYLEHIRLVSLSGTDMLCVPDSPQYSVQVGQIGGNYNLMLKRSNGQVLDYIIVYHDLSVNPDPSPLLRIMNTFQAI
jgi:hypothetical protein